MSKRCDKLQTRAMLDGLDGPGGRAWRLHSRECDACAQELQLLEILEDRGQEVENRHLATEDVTRLMVEVNRLAKRRRRRSLPRLAWKTACVCLLTVGTALAFFANTSNLNSPSTTGAAPGTVASSRDCRDAFAALARNLWPSSSQVDRAAGELATAEQLDQRLHDVRSELTSCREELFSLCREEVDDAYWVHFCAYTN